MVCKQWMGWGRFALAAAIGGILGSGKVDAQTVVELKRTGDAWQLIRNGQPYAIHGVGGQTQLQRLSELGGNSIRTWGTDGLDAILDEAHRHGLSVCVGMWLGHERHGFSYQNADAVAKQMEQCLETVRRFKDHPAVLMWGIGNEMEGNGKNPAIWYAIDHIAREIHRIDPYHPTMTVIAELGEDAEKIRNLERFCHNVDVVGVNSYAGIESLGKRIEAAGATKPYIITEHGPRGPWEVEKTAWGAPIEATSTEKAKLYDAGYRTNVLEHSGRCLGTYAFLWGNKQETTATWFGMILPDGTRLEAADRMSQHWTGQHPSNQCPKIESLTMEGNAVLKPGDVRTLAVQATDPESDPLEVTWIVRSDSAMVGEGGDAQAEERMWSEAIETKGTLAKLTAPDAGGNYRVFVVVRDQRGGAAVANVPWQVDAPRVAMKAPAAVLPFALYRDGSTAPPFVPSGFMGNAQAIALEQNSAQTPRSGASCIRVSYQSPDAWGGVLWQSPANDWKGDTPGGLNFTGAKVLEFWARGEQGGEVVNFLFGAIEGSGLYRDSARGDLKEVRLSDRWQKYQIPLEGRDLSRIKTAFGWSVAGSGQPVVFYLDDIEYR